MVTATLKDSTPTTTIVFDGFRIVSTRREATNFDPFSYPENEGIEIVFEGQFVRVWTITFVLKDDATYPASGDSAADKRVALENFYFTGGDNEWLFILTLDAEDSIPGSSQTEVYTGKIKLFTTRSVGGDNVATIEGEFEFWEDTISWS